MLYIIQVIAFLKSLLFFAINFLLCKYNGGADRSVEH